MYVALYLKLCFKLARNYKLYVKYVLYSWTVFVQNSNNYKLYKNQII